MLTEEELDRVLSGSAPRELEPSAQLRRVVAEIPLRHPRSARGAFDWLKVLLPLPLWSVGAAAAVMLLLGGTAGWLTGDEQSAGADPETIALLTEEADWEELSELALAGNWPSGEGQ